MRLPAVPALLGLAALGLLAGAAAAAPTAIRYAGPPSEAVDDLRQTLQGYEAGAIALESAPLGNRSGQAFYLERKRGRTLIRYTGPGSLENAVYTLLDRWGFHWYGPGANWFVKPAAVPGADIPGRWISPTFRNRSFFGTGGLDVIAPGDPDNRYKAGWYAWKRRNRFGADFPGVGHMGSAFYQENRALLDAHPEWFNGDGGKRNGRLRIEVPEAVTAYKAWVKRRVAGAAGPFVCIGVEPEDGRGGTDDPLPPDGFAGIAGWNHADKWWWLANEVAKDYPADDARVVVTMYAYGDGATNARTPRFPLRKNVYPVIIPYAFQTAYLPEEMVRAWARPCRGHMGVYDYWNITQWSQGLPQLNIYDLPGKLKLWEDNRVDGIYVETTDAAGPMGHAWWLAGQLEFDLSQDLDKLFRQYLSDLFGKAAPAMRRMYDRWSRSPQGAGEVSLSLADLADADRLVPRGGPEWRRINELKAYVHFMKLYYDHDGTQASKDRLLTYLYSIHHLFMVQTSAFIGQSYIAPLDKGNVIPREAVPPLTADQIDAQFRADLASDPKRYNLSSFTFDHRRAKYRAAVDPAAWRFGRNTRAYVVATKTGPLSLAAGAESGDAELTVYTAARVLLRQSVGVGNFDYSDTIDGRTWHMKRCTLNVRAGTTYYIRLRGPFSRFSAASGTVVYAAHGDDDFDNYAYPPHYFYVPRGCTQIVYEDRIGPPGSTPAFYAPEERGRLTSANRGAPLGIRNLYRIAVPPAWRGRVIACSFGHPAWSLKNLPNVFSLQEFEYQE